MKSQSIILSVISLLLLTVLILYLISKPNHFEKEQSANYDQNTSLTNQPNSCTETLSVSADTDIEQIKQNITNIFFISIS